MSALSEVVAACEPELRRHAREQPEFDDSLTGTADPALSFVLEAVREGYLLHYGQGRAFDDMDADLALLAGDALYAQGLSRLAEQGDLQAVEELADLITLSARAHAEGRADLAPKLWHASARRLAGEQGTGAVQCWRDFA